MKKLSGKEKVKFILSIIAYLLFAVLWVSIIVFGQNTFQKWIIVVLFLLVLIGGVFVEYLKQKYHGALYALNFEMNPDKAEALFDELQTKDLFNGYKDTRILFDVQVALYRKEYDKALKIMANNEKFFRSNLQMLHIFQYTRLRCYVAKGDNKRAVEAYKQLQLIAKQKRAPRIFSKEEIEALYQLAIKNKYSAYEKFKAVNMKNMNPKEMEFIIENLYNLTPMKEEKNLYEEELLKIRELKASYEEQ